MLGAASNSRNEIPSQNCIFFKLKISEYEIEKTQDYTSVLIQIGVLL